MERDPSLGMSDEATELMLFGINDGELFEHTTKPTENALIRKMTAGKYDSKLAVKAWRNWADAAAKSYAKQNLGHASEWKTVFPPAVRNEVAHSMRDRFEDERKAIEGVKTGAAGERAKMLRRGPSTKRADLSDMFAPVRR